MAHLIFQTAFPGDLFLSIPLMKRLRAFDPVTPIALACRPGLGDFFLKHRLVDEVVEIDKRNVDGRKSAQERIRGETWDLVLVPHESPRTAWWMRQVRARRGKVGFAKWWNRFSFTHRIDKPSALPDALRQLSLLTAFDRELAGYYADGAVMEKLASPRAQISPFDFSEPRIPQWASMQVSRRDDRAGGTSPGTVEKRPVFLAPGSVWGTKRWTARGYEGLARRLVASGHAVELVGSGAEKELCDAIAAKVPGVGNSAGRTNLSDLVERFACGLALVCNDSGAMHAAAAAGLPTVAVFGPTTLDLGFRPWNERAVVVQRQLKCRPCGRHGAKVCPLGTHECMESISEDEVWRALQLVLASR